MPEQATLISTRQLGTRSCMLWLEHHSCFTVQVATLSTLTQLGRRVPSQQNGWDQARWRRGRRRFPQRRKQHQPKCQPRQPSPPGQVRAERQLDPVPQPWPTSRYPTGLLLLQLMTLPDLPRLYPVRQVQRQRRSTQVKRPMSGRRSSFGHILRRQCRNCR